IYLTRLTIFIIYCRTALHWASHRGHEPIVRALLMRGASKDIVNKKGETPVDLAKKPEICQLFGKEPQTPSTTTASTTSDNDNAGDSSTTSTTKISFIPAYLA